MLLGVKLLYLVLSLSSKTNSLVNHDQTEVVVQRYAWDVTFVGGGVFGVACLTETMIGMFTASEGCAGGSVCCYKFCTVQSAEIRAEVFSCNNVSIILYSTLCRNTCRSVFLQQLMFPCQPSIQRHSKKQTAEL